MSSWLLYRRSAIADIIEKELWERFHCDELPRGDRYVQPYDEKRRIRTISTIRYTFNEDGTATSEIISTGDPEREKLERDLTIVLRKRLEQIR